MQELEDDLLAHLSKPGANLNEDTDLIITLEKGKVMFVELVERVEKAIETGQEISIHHDSYLMVTGRAELLYIILSDLSKINHM